MPNAYRANNLDCFFCSSCTQIMVLLFSKSGTSTLLGSECKHKVDRNIADHRHNHTEAFTLALSLK